MPRQMKIEGVVVEDAAAPVKLQITRQDIARARKKDPEGCVAAQAAMRCFKNVKGAKIHMKCLYLKVEDKEGPRWLRYQTPQKLRNEVIVFDRGGEFEPGEYTLKPNSVSERLGAPRKYKQTKKKVPARGNRYKAVHVPNVRARLGSKSKGEE